MNIPAAIDALRCIPLFDTLTEDELLIITERFRIKRFKKSEIILFEEDTNEYMYIILKGRVKVTQTTEDGKETILSFHQEGEFFGEMSLIDGKTAPATVTATENTLTTIIAKKDFFEVLFSQNKVANNLLKILCFRLRKSWEMIHLLTFNQASERLEMLFYLLSLEYGQETPEGTIIDLRLTHRDLANMAGITRETVTRVLDKWQKEGDVTILKNKIIRLSSRFTRKELNFK
jgi:CRP/FNR family transcriptional regulator